MSGELVDTDITLFGRSVGGWPSTFWVFALAAVVWYPVWLLYAYEKPEDVPSMSAVELDYIRKGI